MDWVTETADSYFLYFWRLENPRLRHWQILRLVRAASGLHTAIFLCPYMAEGLRTSLESLYKVTNSSHGGPTLMN